MTNEQWLLIKWRGAIDKLIAERPKWQETMWFPVVDNGTGLYGKTERRVVTPSGSNLTLANLQDLQGFMEHMKPTPHQIIPSTACFEQFRFPRSKKRRIRKKWAKRPENYRPSSKLFVDERLGIAYVHPLHLERYRKAMVDACSKPYALPGRTPSGFSDPL